MVRYADIAYLFADMKIAAPLLALISLATTSQAALITAVPGPDDQGGMLMPMVTITGTDDPYDPTSGTISVMFNPSSVPLMQSLETWSPGSWFAESAAWTADLGSSAGVGGTPALNAGAGDLFNNQYGFMFMADPMMGAAYVPTGQSLGIRLASISSADLLSFNYVNSQNRWDEVFASVGDQVLWNGSMWHNYFTLPGNAPAGTYTAQFEIFIADEEFTSGTGFADYTTAARNAVANPNFTSAFVNYTWTVVPEPSSASLLAVAVFGGYFFRRRAHGSAS